MFRLQKGIYGYRNKLKVRQGIIVGVLAAFIIAQLLLRNSLTNSTWRNIITVMAILTVLPAANVASPLVAILPYKTSSEDFHKKMLPYEEIGVVLYDLVMTTKEDVLPCDAIVVHPTGVYAYCINQKANEKRAKAAINEIFKAHRLDPNFHITNDYKVFEKRLVTLKPASNYEDDGSVEYACGVLKSLSM